MSDQSRPRWNASHLADSFRTSLLSVFVCSVALVAVSSLAVAQGNITARVDAAGDLWLIGDGGNNSVRLYPYTGPDQFLIDGFGTSTTINGQQQVLVTSPGERFIVLFSKGDNVAVLGADFGSDPSCCDRSLVFIGGPGNDSLHVIGPGFEVAADMGPGDDFISIAFGASAIAGSRLDMGVGNDTLIVNDYISIVDSLIKLGPGDDVLTFTSFGGTTLSGTVIETGDLLDGTSSDRDIVHGRVAGDFKLRTGFGDDLVDLEGVTSGSIFVSAGGGEDWLRLRGDLRLHGLHEVSSLCIDLGSGDDALDLGQLAIASTALDGGPGHDRLRLRGENEFGSLPSVLNFEVPRVMLGAPYDNVTTIVGRVLDETGAPVAGASVLVPAVGRHTTTDTVGAFVLETVRLELGDIQVLVGARVEGRHRTGAALVEMVPLGTSASGDIVLEDRAGNVLIYSNSSFDVRAVLLQRQLRSIGVASQRIALLNALPTSLLPFGVIWDVGSSPHLSIEQQRLFEFVSAGGGLFLTGDVSPQGHVAIESLVNRLIQAEPIDVGTAGVPSGDYQFNPAAAGGASVWPNELEISPVGDFFISRVVPRNRLVGYPNGKSIAAVWEGADLVGGRGRVALYMPGNLFLFSAYAPVLENMYSFLSHKAGTSKRVGR